MTDQFVIDLGNDQRAVVEPDDATWLQEKLRREPGSTRLEIRYDDADTEGHGSLPRVVVIAEGDDDTEGHAIALNFPSREEADAFRKRLMLAGVLAGTIAVGAIGGAGLASMAQDNAAAGAGAASTAVSGSDWSQVERPAAASATGAGSAWTSEERPGTATVSDGGSSSVDDEGTLGGLTPR
jgi:hypothetical protein